MSEVRALSFENPSASRVGRNRISRLGQALGIVAILTLAGCAGTGPFSPVTDLNRTGGGTYTVRPGDTLNSIARQTGVSVERLTALNSISNPSRIQVGQRLRLGEGASMTADMSGSDMTSGSESSGPQTVGRAADANVLDMIWPAKGNIITQFTAETKGIDIAGAVGDPVVASAGGKVVYAGNGVRGLGNLVIVDHGNNFITAYAHNERLLVKAGDQVTKGGQIATVGQTDTTSPRLHFEVRRNGTPVNPLRYLPESQS